ncbi:MAG TPA: ABC transporter substrate-binding protein [Armatimonadota bacterium]|nr:ABC transporter substrate-binding protein [Armatimonadota bacterium]
MFQIRKIVTALLVCAGLVLFWVAFRPQPAPADGKVHVRYWEKWTGFEEDAMRAVVSAFNARQDRIHVEYLAVSQVNQKMLLSTAGGNPPDVAGVWDYDVVTFADYGALRPLDDFCKESGLGPDHYLPAYWNLCVHRDQVFAMPTTPASVALHWNRKMFAEAGLDPNKPPRTLEELDQMAEKLTKRDAAGKIIQMGFLPAEPGWWNWGWGYFFGGQLWDGQSKTTLTTEENLRAFRWVKSYVDKYQARDLSVFQSGFGNFSSPQNAFISGQVAMVLQGVWMANYIHNNNSSLDWEAAPFPPPANRPDLANSTPVGLDVLVIPKGAKHPREAWEFIEFVQSQEGMEMLCLGQWKHSPLAKVSDRFFREHKNKRIKLFYDLAKGTHTFSTPRVGIWREWQDEMKSGFENIWTNGQDPETALRYVQDRVQPKMTRYLESVELRESAKQ